MRSFLLRTVAATAATATFAITGAAFAGGYQLQDHGAVATGRSNAGAVARLDDASTVWFNPAGMGFLDGAQVSVGASVIGAHSDFEDRGTVFTDEAAFAFIAPGPTGGGDGGNPWDLGLAPNLHIAAPIGDQGLWIGLSVSAPFGLRNEFPSDWFGRYDSLQSDLSVMDIQPSIAYRINEQFSIGGGINFQRVDATLRSAYPTSLFHPIFAGADLRNTLDGEDWSIGFNLGAQWQPMEGTRLGAHYRSSVNHSLSGTFTTDLGGVLVASPTTGSVDLDLPAMASLGVAQDIGEQFTVFGQVNWYDWSSYDEIRFVPDGPGADIVEEQEYEDTFSVAMGAEWRATEMITLRAGAQYDETPLGEFRDTRLTDGDRWGASIGASLNINSSLSIDVAYSRLFVETVDVDELNAPIPGTTIPQVNTRAEISGWIDIVGVSARYRF